MLYHILYRFSQEVSGFNVFRYITLRSFLAFLLATFCSILIGVKFIDFMRRRQFGQVVRNDGPKTHFKKAGTPTMGGVFIIASIFFALAFCGNFLSYPLLACLFVTTSFFILGLFDDYLKVLKNNSKGISPRVKLIWQFATSFIVIYWLNSNNVIDTKVYLPFFKDYVFDFDYMYLLFGACVLVGSSNAVNLTDGLDGLAIGPIITTAAALGVLAYVAGHKELSTYLYIPYVENAGELTILCASVMGAGVGFLWYNSYPAQIFMGDVGSLSLGGLLGTVALVTKNEILFLLIGGIFVLEALSVILQVASYKLRKKRIFKMAPLHHHFELLGWPEPKVIVRFWIVSIFLAILSLSTLKIR